MAGLVAENVALKPRVLYGFIEPFGPSRFECDVYRLIISLSSGPFRSIWARIYSEDNVRGV